MDSDCEYSSSDDNCSDPSISFSYFNESSSVKKISEIQQSSSLTPEQSSLYEIGSSKIKDKKNKKASKVKSKVNQKQNRSTQKANQGKKKKNEISIDKKSKKLILTVVSEAKIRDEKASVNSNRFALRPKEAIYLTISQFPKRYSLRDVNRPEEVSTDFGLKDNTNVIYSEGYYLLENFINQMLQCEDLPQFFKQGIDEVSESNAARNYYIEYTKIISKPLSLSSLLWMIKNGIIKNFFEFKKKFQSMIFNNQYFHTLKGNLHLIQGGEFLKKKFEEKFCRQVHPQGNIFEQYLIKTMSQKIPKLQEGNEIRYMKLTDEQNKYRFSVMNQFLANVCEKVPEKVEVLIGTIQNIISRYPNSKLKLIKRESDELKEQKEKKPRSKDLNFKLKLPSESLLDSPHSTNSRALSQSEGISLKIVPIKIEIDLFQQLKALIRREVQEKRPLNIFDQVMRDETDRVMYPHEDSDDFDFNDDSDDDT